MIGGKHAGEIEDYQRLAVDVFVEFVEFSKSRSISGSSHYRSYCGCCGQAMRVDAKTLFQEWLGIYLICGECGWRGGGFRGSPQESVDIRYHGDRFYSGEW